MKESSSMFDKYGESYKAGDILFCEYEPGEHLFIIQEGNVRVTKVVDNKEKTLDEFGNGDMFGEMAILEQAPRSATAIAMDDVKVLKFNQENFDVLLENQPQLGLNLLKSFSKRIYEAKRRFMVLSFDDPETRILDALLMLAEQEGAKLDKPENFEIDTNIAGLSKWCAIQESEAKKAVGGIVKSGKIEYKEKENKVIIKNIVELNRIITNRRKMLVM